MACIFCKIAKGEIPSSKVYENDLVFAFLDISPANKGHTLVIPKEHYETMLDTPDDIAAEMMHVASKLSKAVMRNADGFNIMVNNKEAAGQEVMHVHLHIMPRFTTDDFKFKWTHKKYEEGEIDKVKEEIISSI